MGEEGERGRGKQGEAAGRVRRKVCRRVWPRSTFLPAALLTQHVRSFISSLKIQGRPYTSKNGPNSDLINEIWIQRDDVQRIYWGMQPANWRDHPLSEIAFT